MSRYILPIKHFEYDHEKTLEENKKAFIDNLSKYRDYCEYELRKQFYV